MRIIKILLVFLSMHFFTLVALKKGESRGSSYPYISGDTFRSMSDYVYDETTRFNPNSVTKDRCIIFVKTDFLNIFFTKMFPKIKKKFALITHNSDYAIPGKFSIFLNHEKLIAWFGQNVEDYPHPKLYPIPIGLANKQWSHGNTKTFDFAIQNYKKLSHERSIFLYMNFAPTDKSRTYVFNLFHDKSYCTYTKPKSINEYLQDLGNSVFILSPRGNGWDCHRTWEALLMGAYPIVQKSGLDPMYENLPVVIVNDWADITYEFLIKKYEEFTNKDFSLEKIYFDFWINKIREITQNS